MKKLGIIGNSFKENEKRLPIHPSDFCKIDNKYRQYIYIDEGYGNNFGYSDNDLKKYVNILPKNKIYEECDIVLVLKYTYDDYKLISSNKICWGWHHLVQNKQNVDLIIEKKITAISIEQMFENGIYILEDNRLIAGYASIMHALQLKGLTGYLSTSQPKIAILSYGCVGKGAIDAFISLGMTNIDVFTQRDPSEVKDRKNNIKYVKYVNDDERFNTLEEYDIVVNCILQDPLKPKIFLKEDELKEINKKMFIIDISCDPGMGFDFAVCTTFDEPIIKINDNVDFYGVDHSPSVYYNTISQKISQKIINYIPYVIDDKINDNATLRNAIEIDKGIVINGTINKFQNRN